MARVGGAAQKIPSKQAGKPQRVGSVRSQPLAGKSFYLDLPSGKSLELLAKFVERVGGVVESFLSKEVTCIVSNSPEARKKSWGKKQTASVLRNTQAGTQTSVELGRGHQHPSHKPADAVLATRGKALLQKAIRNQSSPCGSNSILAKARSWGIQIMHTDEMTSYIQWLEMKCCRSTRQMKCFPSGPQSALKVVRLQAPFLKVEDESRCLRPVVQQFKSFPELFFLEVRRGSPFNPPQSPAGSKAPAIPPAHRDCSSDGFLVPKRQRGYCECCEEDFADLQMHLQSPRHTAFSLDTSHYAPVDSLISQMTNDFAVSPWPSLPRRVPLAAYDDLSGLQEDPVERIVASSGQPQKSCLPGEGSGGQPASPKSSARLPEDQSFGGQMDLPWETFNSPVLLTSQSPQSPSGRVSVSSGAEHHRRGRGMNADAPLKAADAPLKAAVSPEVGSWPAPQQKKTWAPPILLPPRPRKRKLSYSPRGQAKKRPVLTGRLLSQPDTNALPGISPVGTTEHFFPQEYGSQTDLGCLRLPAAPAAEPHCLRSPTQFPQEGSARPPRERAVTDTGCLTRPAQQLEQEEGSAAHPSEERHAQISSKSPSVGAELGMPSFPVGKRVSPQLLGSVVQPYSSRVGPSQFIQAVGPERFSPSLPPLSCSEEPPSSESEWDRPLLCALEGTSHLPLNRPMDSVLLGTYVSLQGSGYESHLRSVLGRTLEPHEAHCRDASGCHARGEVQWASLNSLFLNEPTPLPPF